MLHGIRDNTYLLSKKRIGSFIRQIHVIIKHDQGKLLPLVIFIIPLRYSERINLLSSNDGTQRDSSLELLFKRNWIKNVSVFKCSTETK